LTTTHSLANMVAIDGNNYPRRYATPEDILETWMPQRLRFYNKRKDYLLDLYNHDLKRANNKYVYVKAVVDKKLNMYQADDALELDMLKLGLEKMTTGVDSDKEPTFEYLLSMQMRSMTVKKLTELKKEADDLRAKITELEGKDGKDLWLEDLDNFDKAYAKYLKDHPLV